MSVIKVINSVASPKIDKGVLFPFDNASIPFSTGLRLQLINGQSPYNGNPIVLRNGNPGEPDVDMAIFYGTVLNIDGELRKEEELYIKHSHDSTPEDHALVEKYKIIVPNIS